MSSSRYSLNSTRFRWSRMQWFTSSPVSILFGISRVIVIVRLLRRGVTNKMSWRIRSLMNGVKIVKEINFINEYKARGSWNGLTMCDNRTFNDFKWISVEISLSSDGVTALLMLRATKFWHNAIWSNLARDMLTVSILREATLNISVRASESVSISSRLIIYFRDAVISKTEAVAWSVTIRSFRIWMERCKMSRMDLSRVLK